MKSQSVKITSFIIVFIVLITFFIPAACNQPDNPITGSWLTSNESVILGEKMDPGMKFIFTETTLTMEGITIPTTVFHIKKYEFSENTVIVHTEESNEIFTFTDNVVEYDMPGVGTLHFTR